MAESISSIGAGKDYATPFLWHAGEVGSIASGDQVVGEVYGFIADANTLIFSGWTCTDLTSRIILRPAAGEKHLGYQNSGAGVHYNFGSGDAIAVTNASQMNLDIQGLEWRTNSGGSAAIFRTSAPGTAYDMSIDSCILWRDGALANGARGVYMQASPGAGSEMRVDNTIVQNIQYGIYGNSGARDTTLVRHCLVQDASAQAILYSLAYPAWVFDGNPDYQVNDAASDFLISHDTSASGAAATTSLISKTASGDYFNNYPTDLTPIGTTQDGGIFGVTGMGITKLAAVPNDILGNPRNATTDIGPFEFGAGPSGGIIPLIMHHRQLQRRR